MLISYLATHPTTDAAYMKKTTAKSRQLLHGHVPLPWMRCMFGRRQGSSLGLTANNHDEFAFSLRVQVSV